MLKVSSYRRGNDFEKEVFDVIKRYLISDNFICPSKRSEIFRHKKYYSPDRCGKITVDISIETKFDDTEEYSLLTIIECKNYSKAVDVSDVEEFRDKIRQIGANKGFLITSSKFTETGINIAKKSGITLCILKNEDLDYVKYRTGCLTMDLYAYVNNVLVGNKEIDSGFYALDRNFSFDNLSKLLIKYGIIDRNSIRSVSVPYFTKDFIENEAIKIRNDLQEMGKYNFNYDVFVDFLHTRYGLLIEEKPIQDKNNKEILGMIDFEKNIITISESFENMGRKFFTLAHEAGHYILHKDVLCDNDLNVIQDSIIENNERRLEFQANLFASYILVPEYLLKQQINISFDRNRVNRGRLYWDKQQVNYRLANYVLEELSRYFKVSKEVIKIRMLQNETLIMEDDFEKMDVLIKRHLNQI